MKAAVVYRVYDENGDALYVGISRQLHVRQRAHRSTAPWIDQVARVEVDGPFPEPIAQAVERQQILKLQPRHNVRKRREPTVVVSLHLPRRIHEGVERAAAQSNRIFVEQVRFMLDEYVVSRGCVGVHRQLENTFGGPSAQCAALESNRRVA